MSISFGVDRLIEQPALLGKISRVGLLTNNAARLASDAGRSSRSALLGAGIPVQRLFSPEHGLTAAAADGAAVGDGTDPVTGLQVISLYGSTLTPPAGSLSDLDALLFDVPDVGARFYTYTWTLSHAIDACATAGIPIIILDRPNPLGGRDEDVEGPVIDARHFSFVGRHSIPIRHSLTLGEFALLWQRERCPPADVRIVRCTGWSREDLWPDTGLPFVPTSPAITTFEAALLYPGLCVFEATNVSVARGTAFSFRAIGAPWLNAEELISRFQERSIDAVQLEPVDFIPTVGPHAGMTCRGFELRPLDAHDFKPVATGLALLADVIAAHRTEFAWATYPTAANPAGAGHFERIVGVDGVREVLLDGRATATMIRNWTASPGWRERWETVNQYESRTEQPITD